MAWNEPGGNGDKDPWGNRGNQGPPDLDEVFRNFQRKFGSLFGGKGGRGGGGRRAGPGGMGIGIVIAIILVFWMATGFYKIEEAERGIILRFGEHVDTTQSGLHWHWPTPIESVTKVDVTKVTPSPLRATMLTQDENIVDIEGTIQYQVADPTAFLFNVRTPEVSLSQAAESALREIIGKSKMDYVITEGRGQIGFQVEQLIQEILDFYATGIKVIKVNILSAKPPEPVKDAFDDVTQAREDEVRLVNEAEAYRNEVVPKARGAAARLREEADGYKQEVIARAEGEADRFSQQLAAYERSPAVTRDRLYLDMMESVLGNSSKVLVDIEGNNNLLYLPLDKLMSRSSSAESLGDNLTNLQQQQEFLRQVQQQTQRTRNNLRTREAR